MLEQNKTTTVLREIKNSGVPVGASFLSKKLAIPPATIGRILTKLDNEGLLQKVSNKGRQLTEEGDMYLAEQNLRNAKFKTANKLINLTESVSKDMLLEILEARILLEGRTVELACKNASDEHFHELDRIIFENIYEINRGGLGNEQDLQLHLAIAKMSGNTTIYQILKLILTEKNVYTKFSSVADSVKTGQLEQHGDIVQSIKDRDPVLAKAAIENHLKHVISSVEKYFGDKDNN